MMYIYIYTQVLVLIFIYLCKYVGDYNITKYGDKLMFENSDTALVLKRLN